MDDAQGVYCSALCKPHCSKYSFAYSSRGLSDCNQKYTGSTHGCIAPGRQCGTVGQPEILPKHLRHSRRVKKSRAKRAPNTAICSFDFRGEHPLLASPINSPNCIEFLPKARSLRITKRQDASAGKGNPAISPYRELMPARRWIGGRISGADPMIVVCFQRTIGVNAPLTRRGAAILAPAGHPRHLAVPPISPHSCG